MNLYSVHCGFYDEDISDGVYEFHVNIPVVANNTEEAKVEVRASPIFKKKKMHIDGIQEIRVVQGFSVTLDRIAEDEQSERTDIRSERYRDL